jgi:hypothetical protein
MRITSAIILLSCFTLTACSGDSNELAPTTSEIEAAISEANYCEVAEDCGFVDSCWCGAVANVAELASLQALVSEWKQDPVHAENCATSDCMGFSDIVCELAVCVAIEDD